MIALGAVVVAVVALIAGLAFSGAATPTLIADPGPLVRWGLPLVQLLTDLSATVTVGALAMCAVVLPRSRPAAPARGETPDGAAWLLARGTAAVASVVWTVSLAVEIVLTYAQVAGRPIGGETFGAELRVFLTQIELGQALVWALGLTATVSLGAVAVGGYASAAWAAVGSLIAFVPIAATGHASGSANHMLAVGSLWLHLSNSTISPAAGRCST